MRLILVIFSLFIAGCSHPAAIQARWENFSEAWHLSNGKIDVVVVPSIGRIMHFGPTTGHNVLWVQPDAARYNKQYVGFDNYGGEKIWLWPQETWPPAGDGIRYHAEYRDNVLTLTSEVIAPYNIQIIRTIALHASKPSMTVTSRFKPATPEAKPPRVALWTVAQIRLPDLVNVELDRDAHPPYIADLGILPAWPITSLKDRTATFVRDPKLEAKSGLESSAITIVYPEIALRYTATHVAHGLFDPHTRAQVYVQSDTFNTHPPHLPPYAEIEFVSSWPTDSDPWPALIVTWSLDQVVAAD